MKTTILVFIVAVILILIYTYFSRTICYEIIVDLDIYNNVTYSKTKITC